LRLLVVDDDPGLVALIRATFEGVSAEVVEAPTAAAARGAVAELPPDVIVLDVMLGPDSGLEICRELKANPDTAGIPVVLLSGSIDLASRQAAEAGADAYMAKPFSPLYLVELVEELGDGLVHAPELEPPVDKSDDAQLLLYARDLSRIVELERAQRRLLQDAFGATIGALAEALATKDTGHRAHSRRVQLYAAELTRAVEPSLAADASIEYGFLLHDVGKLGIPDRILQKTTPLSPEEHRVLEQHPIIGYEMLRGIQFLQGEGLAVVRSHHERYDGQGYPDRLAGADIPLAARIFAVADALDAITSDRPHRPARLWRDATAEIASEAGTQFDPRVVAAFGEIEPRLQTLRRAACDT
jgi:ribonuclease P protein subunit RPR2